MLDVGFEEDLNAILADLNRRAENAGRCTALLSATLTAGTSRPIDLAMTDPVTIEIDPEERTSARGRAPRDATDAQRRTRRRRKRRGGRCERERPRRPPARARDRSGQSGRETDGDAHARTAATHRGGGSRQGAFGGAGGAPAGWMRGSVPKVMVFLSSCESVEFHYRVLSWLAAGGKARATGEVDDAGAGGGGGGYSVFRLHGVLSQADRRAVYQGFAAARAGVLLCTDVGARGLDFTGVGATVQVDPPSDPTTYVHRVGRTARLGREGEAVLFYNLARRSTRRCWAT